MQTVALWVIAVALIAMGALLNDRLTEIRDALRQLAEKR